MRRTTLVALSAAMLAACQKSPEPPKVPLSQMNQAPAAGQGAAPAMDAGLTGAVQEQLSAPPYTYLRIKTAKGDVWAAVPAANVAVGTTVTVANPLLMTKFESKSLKRTFDEVYFGNLAGAGAAAAPGGTAAAGAAPTGPAGKALTVGTPTAERTNVGKVAKALGVDARTVAEVWAQKASLAGKTAIVRGVVVKYNAGVMGKNWIHLQDGSGDASKGDFDITVTSLDGAVMGGTITVTGTVGVNRDFGAGYSYPVMIENAKVIKR